MKFCAVVLLATLAVFASADVARYDNYRLYTFAVETQRQLGLVKSLAANPDGLIFWDEPQSVGSRVEVVVPPHKRADFTEIMNNLELEPMLKSDNLQQAIDEEGKRSPSRAWHAWTEYQTLEEIYEWIDSLLVTYSSILSPVEIGESFLGVKIRGVKLSHKSGNPVIVIESNIHAREWITSATATYLLNELLTSTDAGIVDLATNYDWVIVPVLNVDGFKYTKTDNRMWRKTRQPHSALCYGADPNRNFGFVWNTIGASNNPCSDTFAGPNAFSEPETEAFKNYVEGIKDQAKLYLAFHSYGQYVLVPYGHTSVRPFNYENQMQIAKAGHDAILAIEGTQYTVGTPLDVLYATSGTSSDWAFDAGIDVSFTLEFRDLGANGFILPAAQIIPNAKEAIAGIKAIVAETKVLGYFD